MTLYVTNGLVPGVAQQPILYPNMQSALAANAQPGVRYDTQLQQQLINASNTSQGLPPLYPSMPPPSIQPPGGQPPAASMAPYQPPANPAFGGSAAPWLDYGMMTPGGQPPQQPYLMEDLVTGPFKDASGKVIGPGGLTRFAVDRLLGDQTPMPVPQMPAPQRPAPERPAQQWFGPQMPVPQMPAPQQRMNLYSRQQAPRDMVAREAFYNANPMQRMRDDRNAQRLQEMQRARNLSQRMAYARSSGPDYSMGLSPEDRISVGAGSRFGVGDPSEMLIGVRRPGQPDVAYRNYGQQSQEVVGTGDYSPLFYKKGGLVKKPVWEKERPEDLGKPKSLSVKRKASAKRRAKAAGRPYPNLIDNMAAARKKGK